MTNFDRLVADHERLRVKYDRAIGIVNSLVTGQRWDKAFREAKETAGRMFEIAVQLREEGHEVN